MIRRLVLITGLLAVLVLPAVALSSPASAAKFGDAASRGLKCSSSFLGFPAWFDGLPRKNGTCQMELPTSNNQAQSESRLSGFVFRIVLNITEIVLRLIGFAAVGFIIYGGFKYLTSAGSADRITSGRKIIQNALIGLVLSFFSVGIVNLIAGNLG